MASTPNAQYFDSLSREDRRKLLIPSTSYSTFDDDDPFWDDYNQLNPLYRKQLDPYLNYNYKLGLFDKLGNWLGFNTSEDKYKMQMQQQARAALAGLQSDVFQNSYNSQSAQASRQRDAGLNPDLAGEAEGEPASGLEQPLSPIDPSIFDPPQNLLPDITSLLGTACEGLQSFATFKKLIADVGLIGQQRLGTEISSYDSALDVALKYISSANPRRLFPDLSDDVDPGTEDFFNQKLIPSLVSSVDKQFSHLSPEGREWMRKAILAQSQNPVAYDNYYKGFTSMNENRINYAASQQAFGDLTLADDMFSRLNSITIGHRISSMKSLFELTDTINSYNVQKYKNDFNYEQWKTEHNVPENVGQAELEGYIAAAAKASADAANERMRLDVLNYLDELKKKDESGEFDGDIGAKYLYYSLVSKFNLPMISSSLSGSVLGSGGSASWMRPFMPGESAGLGLFPAGSTDFDGSDKYRMYFDDLK